ncbi:MAG: HAMP domain-containing histidine kinase [Chloroflexi bacterium]|nr:HAMP domain-containing histidine kinase [Chloroflexota bacterium]
MRARWSNLPLRLRLTFLYVGLLVAILVALGTFLYVDTRDFMISSTAMRLEAQANVSISHWIPPAQPAPRLPPLALSPRDPITSTTLNPPPFEFVARSIARDLTWQDTAAVVLSRSGALIADGRESPTRPAIPPPEPAELARANAGYAAYYSTTVDQQDMLVVLIPLRYPRFDSPITGVLQTTISLDLVDQVLGRQRLLIVVGVLLALVLAGAGGLWLTQTALTPLHVMIDVCRRIADGDLSQRVNLPQRRDETGQLAAAFDEMVERLDDSFATQRQFVADASHELRTPLTAISGSLEVLLLAPEGDPDTSRRVLHGMRREVQRLTRLVADLLTLTRLDAKRGPTLAPVDVAALAREVVEGIKPLAGERQIDVKTEGDTTGRGDADQLKQVFYNLVANAIQFTDAEQGKIELRIQGADGAVRVSVTDNGVGIPNPAQSRIFERFYRADRARTRASGGSGLGLAIVKAIVESHGGTIDPVDSKPGRGTTIQFTLKREPAEPGPAQAAPPAS